MGPYPTREAAADALVTARARTVSWDAAERRPVAHWAPPPPQPLTRVDRWVLRHRGAVRAGGLVVSAVLLVPAVRDLLAGGGTFALWYWAFVCAWYPFALVSSLVRRERAIERASSDGAATSRAEGGASTGPA